MPQPQVQLNGRPVHAAVPALTPLLTWLRNDCGLNGPKYGCGLGECGACMVLVDGRAARSCTLAVATVLGRNVTTLEGLGAEDALHPVQQAFIDAQAAQCGYCLNGMIIATTALLSEVPQPTEAQVRAALSHNLCRCGTHVEILRAVSLAARRMAGASRPAHGMPAASAASSPPASAARPR
jgi:nicotinate dehydrogenase subunit A